MQELTSLIINAPMAAAVIVAVQLMLKAQQKERNEIRGEQQRERDGIRADQQEEREAWRKESQVERQELHRMIEENLDSLTEAVRSMTTTVSRCQRN